MDKINTFVDRLSNIGIDVELMGNFPWIYLYKVNGNIVKDIYNSEYYFTVAFYPKRVFDEIKFTDIKEIFNVIRKYK